MMRILKLSLFVLLLVVGVGSLEALAGQKPAATNKPVQVTKNHPAVFACPKCEVASMKPGKCSMCGAKMEKVNAKLGYGCADCHVFSANAGKCPKCGAKMAKAAETYACEHCHVSALKAGKCPKCGHAMTKYDMKVG